jgi:hypothetical protein
MMMMMMMMMMILVYYEYTAATTGLPFLILCSATGSLGSRIGLCARK